MQQCSMNAENVSSGGRTKNRLITSYTGIAQNHGDKVKSYLCENAEKHWRTPS